MARCRPDPSHLQRRGLRPLMRRDLEHRLAHVETLAQAMSRVDRQAADHRQVLRGSVVLRQFIRERLRILGIDLLLQSRSRAAMKRRLNWRRSRIHPNCVVRRIASPARSSP